MNSVIRLMLITSTLSAVVACSTLVVEPGQMPMGIDNTIGRDVVSADKHIVLVTITNELHAKLSQGESVRLEGRLPPLYARFIAQMHSEFGFERIADWPLEEIDIRCLVFETDRPVTPSVLEALREHRLVDSAQLMQYFAVSGELQKHSYDDPYHELQEGHDALQVAATHKWSTGRGVVVAVIDTGMDSNHADLKDRMYGIRNFVDRRYDVFNDDIHGTAVAGVIAATANNGTGIVGVAPESQLLGLKACAQPASGAATATCNSFTLAKALNFAIQEHVNVINMSLAGPRDALLERLVRRAIDDGIVVVGSVGRTPDQEFPAAIGGVVGVGTEDNADASNIVAPGQQVVTTVPDDGYDFFSGNSIAAAQISGVVALIRQRKPHISVDVVHQLLEATRNEATGYASACQALARIVDAGTSSRNGCDSTKPTENVANSPPGS